MLTFWNSVEVLRQIEFATVLVAMIVPILCGAILLSVHYRVKALVNKTTVIQDVSYETNVQRLDNTNEALLKELRVAQTELSRLRHETAGRFISETQENILVQRLNRVKAVPVIVSAYAFEDESASYAADIAAVLRKANWQVIVNKSSMNDFKGVSLGTVNLSQRPLAGEHELAQAFSEAHLDVHQREIAPDSIAGQLQDGCLLVVVGRK